MAVALRTSNEVRMRLLPIVGLLLALATTRADAASLWQGETLSDGTLYSDQVARRAGDLITILVKETTAVTDKNKTETKRDNTIAAELTMLPQNSALPSVQGTSTVGKLPALAMDSHKDFKGQGDYDSASDVRATITGRVLDVLDNGNLLVEGRRSVKVNLDTKTIVITGIVRTADIKSDNTVMSEKLHDFQVSIVGEGPLNRSQAEGWLGRLVDTLWPF
jgi:flagellar L-ring protein FlgH